MTHQLQQLLREKIIAGLKRRAVSQPSVWASSYRVMGQPYPGLFNFKKHPWAKEMHDCDCEMMIGQKAAQLGFTEVALNKVFFKIDIEGISCMYIFPANSEASDFSSSRFDPALEMSKHLQALFSDVKNVGHKRAGSANLYLRGSRSRSQLKSVPVGLVVLDELDEFKQENIPLIFERMSGQVVKQSFLLSTPTIDYFGINGYYRQSTQEHFFFHCPHCSKLTELTFPECLVVTADDWMDKSIEQSHLICKECTHVLDHNTKSEWLSVEGRNPAIWVPQETDRLIRGFHVNQLYSATVRPDELAVSFLKAQTNPTDEQEFFNSKLGLCHIVEGARITDIDIEECRKSYAKTQKSPTNSLVTMGVDVGKFLHYEIDQWYLDEEETSIDTNMRSKGRLLTEGKCLNFEDLDTLMKRYGVSFCVIDANPERRKALEFAQRFYGYVRLCFYANNLTGKNFTLHPQDQHTVSVDRTSWIDLSLGRLIRRKLDLPRDISMEYQQQLKALVRVYKKDTLGNPVGRYERGNQDDHFAHARTYSEIALQLVGSSGGSYDITGVY